MKRQIVFATNNQNKVKEIRSILGNQIEILSLSDIQCDDELPETQDTLEGNALQKAQYVFDNYGQECFADDTGLEIDALNGEPGVYSARYAGPDCSFQDNTNKVLKLMKGEANRKAKFRTVVSLILDSKEYQFEGIMEGTITDKESNF